MNCRQHTNILVTGANGFVGEALVTRLSICKGVNVRETVRSQTTKSGIDVQTVRIGDLTGGTDWKGALKDVNVVVHAAARVHVMDDTAADPLSEFRKINVEGTLNLARQAAAAKTKRFIFISSIKVNGEINISGRPFTTDDHPNPLDPYGVSKWETEVGLQKLVRETGMEVVIIRPPLIYGPGVKANFQSLMRLINRGVPLPLGAIHNKRSLVALDNLVDLIVTCIEHPTAANQTFLAGDGEDVSTTELLRKIGKALGKPARLIPVPASLLTIAASSVGKKVLAQRLCGSLQVDISRTCSMLGWEPPVSLDEGLRLVAEDFKEHNNMGNI